MQTANANNLDRYFYSIETDVDGAKFIHLSGNIYFNDADGSETDHRIAEWTFFFIDINDARQMVKDDTFYEYVNERVNYLSNVTKAEALEACEAYFEGEPGVYLPISEITDSTPCGNYWFG